MNGSLSVPEFPGKFDRDVLRAEEKCTRCGRSPSSGHRARRTRGANTLVEVRVHADIDCRGRDAEVGADVGLATQVAAARVVVVLVAVAIAEATRMLDRASARRVVPIAVETWVTPSASPTLPTSATCRGCPMAVSSMYFMSCPPLSRGALARRATSVPHDSSLSVGVQQACSASTSSNHDCNEARSSKEVEEKRGRGGRAGRETDSSIAVKSQ